MIQKPRVPPLLVLAFGILAVSTASIFIRFGQSYAPSLVIAAYRLLIATLLITPFVYFRKRSEIVKLNRGHVLLALLSGIFLALHFATWITSLEYTTVVSSVVLVSTTPLWVALIAPFTIKEPLTRLVLLGLLIALIGGIIIGLSDICHISSGTLECPSSADFIRGKAIFGDFLALVGALMAAGYLIIGRRLRVSISLTSYVFIVYGMAAIILLLAVLIQGLPMFAYPKGAFLWFFLLALIPQLMGHTSFNWALGFLSAVYVSISLLGEPIGSTILAFLILGETPTYLKLFGAILILAGIYLASKGETRQRFTNG